MNDDEMPLTLPDTQNADEVKFTQSQEAPRSQDIPKIWGRLCPKKSQFSVIELKEDEYTLGRSARCNICVSTREFSQRWLNTISKTHFRIIRKKVDNSGTSYTVIYLEDFSHNGTFVNNKLVGKDKQIILENNDVIALSQPANAVYIFMSSMAFESSGLPAELRSKYAVSRTLGTGACGEVKMIFTKIGCKKLAMKMISKKGLGSSNSLNNSEKIMNEVKILKALRHPCVIRMEEIVDTPTTVYIVLELMEGGELFDRIRSSQTGLSERIAKLIFYQVVLAVHYLHSCGITHRDLKPENILLASEAEVTLTKVSDFGLSKLVDTESMMKTFCGTPMYVAPEILLTGGRGSYTSQVDVWSLGVILYCCLSGLVPFCVTNKENVSLHEQITNARYKFPASRFEKVSARAIDLIKRMLIVDPNKRLSISQVLNHPWMQDPTMRNTVSQLISNVGDENSAPPLSIAQNEERAEQHACQVKEFVKRTRLN